MTAQETTTPTPDTTNTPAPAPATESKETKCAECGKPANVPFTPDPSRPVYCRDCFGKRPRGAGRPGGRGFGFGGPRPEKLKGMPHGYSRFDYPGYEK